jgi:glyoxylase I family protein
LQNIKGIYMLKNDFILHHASLVVSNTAASLEFYSGVLGLELTDRPDLGFPGAWLKLGEQQIHLLELPTVDPTTGRPAHGGRDRHVALSTRNVDLVRAALDEAGWAYTLSISGRRALFCRDPDGNAIEVLER